MIILLIASLFHKELSFLRDKSLITFLSLMLHLLKKKKWGKVGNFAFKLNMSKAYDWVEWDFCVEC